MTLHTQTPILTTKYKKYKEQIMPYADFGEELSFNSSHWMQLKAKGDSVLFRLIGAPYYDGKHIFEDGRGGWFIEDCDRVNKGTKCAKCQIFFEHKEEEKAETDPEKKKELGKQARKYQAKVTFYYPILNRKDKKFQVLKTTFGVRNKIENEAAAGVKIMERDFVLKRTEAPGADFYSLTRIDSADSEPLDETEKAEIEKGKAVNVEKMVNGKADEGTETSLQANSRQRETNYGKRWEEEKPAGTGPSSDLTDDDFKVADDVPF